jgi:hypothetical protein
LKELLVLELESDYKEKSPEEESKEQFSKLSKDGNEILMNQLLEKADKCRSKLLEADQVDDLLYENQVMSIILATKYINEASEMEELRKLFEAYQEKLKKEI